MHERADPAIRLEGTVDEHGVGTAGAPFSVTTLDFPEAGTPGRDEALEVRAASA